jgi:hypothetical protein
MDDMMSSGVCVWIKVTMVRTAEVTVEKQGLERSGEEVWIRERSFGGRREMVPTAFLTVVNDAEGCKIDEI